MRRRNSTRGSHFNLDFPGLPPHVAGGVVLGVGAHEVEPLVHGRDVESPLRRAFASALLSVSLFAVARVASADDAYATDSLLRDLERIVDGAESTGWFGDEEALSDLRDDVLGSVCRTPPAARDGALRWLLAEHARLGDARALWEARGRELDSDVKRARFVERELLVLRHAMERAPTSCPFWVVPNARFRGRQSDRDRFTLNVESGGSAQLRVTEGTATIGAGGLGRALFGYGFCGDTTLLAGFEFGGGAMLKPGVEPTEFVVNYFPAVPVTLRLRDLSWHYDVEVAPVALFQADDGDFSFGFRTGLGVGLSGLRTRNLLPWAGAVIAYEHYFASGGRAAAHFLRGGVRVGVAWDFADGP